MTGAPGVEDLLRQLAPQVLGALVRRSGDLDASEDAVQEALLEASQTWPAHGVPERPRGWLLTVASRRLTDHWRAEAARRAREARDADRIPADTVHTAPADEATGDEDDSLVLLLMCCHPGLSRASQVALTLRAVGGLTTAEIARAFLTPEATVAQRISRAKRQLRDAGATFAVPAPGELDDRVAAVLHVLYLVFNEGYTASSGEAVQRVDLTAEAIRLTRMLHAQLPHHGEVAGLLALMLLTAARSPARTTATGDLVRLEEQDRSRWRADLIAEGTALLEQTLATAVLGPYQLQAAVATLHDQAPGAEDTDWPQILALYQILEAIDPSPMTRLSTAVATAMVHGIPAGLRALDTLADDPVLAGHHRRYAVLAHLLELDGRAAEAAEAYGHAATRTVSLPEQRYLLARKRRLAEGLGRRRNGDR